MELFVIKYFIFFKNVDVGLYYFIFFDVLPILGEIIFNNNLNNFGCLFIFFDFSILDFFFSEKLNIYFLNNLCYKLKLYDGLDSYFGFYYKHFKMRWVYSSFLNKFFYWFPFSHYITYYFSEYMEVFGLNTMLLFKPFGVFYIYDNYSFFCIYKWRLIYVFVYLFVFLVFIFYMKRLDSFLCKVFGFFFDFYCLYRIKKIKVNYNSYYFLDFFFLYRSEDDKLLNKNYDYFLWDWEDRFIHGFYRKHTIERFYHVSMRKRYRKKFQEQKAFLTLWSKPWFLLGTYGEERLKYIIERRIDYIMHYRDNYVVDEYFLEGQRGKNRFKFSWIFHYRWTVLSNRIKEYLGPNFKREDWDKFCASDKIYKIWYIMHFIYYYELTTYTDYLNTIRGFNFAFYDPNFNSEDFTFPFYKFARLFLYKNLVSYSFLDWVYYYKKGIKYAFYRIFSNRFYRRLMGVKDFSYRVYWDLMYTAFFNRYTKHSTSEMDIVSLKSVTPIDYLKEYILSFVYNESIKFYDFVKVGFFFTVEKILYIDIYELEKWKKRKRNKIKFYIFKDFLVDIFFLLKLKIIRYFFYFFYFYFISFYFVFEKIFYIFKKFLFFIFLFFFFFFVLFVFFFLIIFLLDFSNRYNLSFKFFNLVFEEYLGLYNFNLLDYLFFFREDLDVFVKYNEDFVLFFDFFNFEFQKLKTYYHNDVVRHLSFDNYIVNFSKFYLKDYYAFLKEDDSLCKKWLGVSIENAFDIRTRSLVLRTNEHTYYYFFYKLKYSNDLEHNLHIQDIISYVRNEHNCYVFFSFSDFVFENSLYHYINVDPAIYYQLLGIITVDEFYSFCYNIEDANYGIRSCVFHDYLFGSLTNYAINLDLGEGFDYFDEYLYIRSLYREIYVTKLYSTFLKYMSGFDMHKKFLGFHINKSFLNGDKNFWYGHLKYNVRLKRYYLNFIVSKYLKAYKTYSSYYFYDISVIDNPLLIKLYDAGFLNRLEIKGMLNLKNYFFFFNEVYDFNKRNILYLKNFDSINIFSIDVISDLNKCVYEFINNMYNIEKNLDDIDLFENYGYFDWHKKSYFPLRQDSNEVYGVPGVPDYMKYFDLFYLFRLFIFSYMDLIRICLGWEWKVYPFNLNYLDWEIGSKLYLFYEEDELIYEYNNYIYNHSNFFLNWYFGIRESRIIMDNKNGLIDKEFDFNIFIFLNYIFNRIEAFQTFHYYWFDIDNQFLSTKLYKYFYKIAYQIKFRYNYRRWYFVWIYGWLYDQFLVGTDLFKYYDKVLRILKFNYIFFYFNYNLSYFFFYFFSLFWFIDLKYIYYFFFLNLYEIFLSDSILDSYLPDLFWKKEHYYNEMYSNYNFFYINYYNFYFIFYIIFIFYFLLVIFLIKLIEFSWYHLYFFNLRKGKKNYNFLNIYLYDNYLNLIYNDIVYLAEDKYLFRHFKFPGVYDLYDPKLIHRFSGDLSEYDQLRKLFFHYLFKGDFVDLWQSYLMFDREDVSDVFNYRVQIAYDITRYNEHMLPQFVTYYSEYYKMDVEDEDDLMLDLDESNLLIYNWEKSQFFYGDDFRLYRGSDVLSYNYNNIADFYGIDLFYDKNWEYNFTRTVDDFEFSFYENIFMFIYFFFNWTFYDFDLCKTPDFEKQLWFYFVYIRYHLFDVYMDWSLLHAFSEFQTFEHFRNFPEFFLFSRFDNYFWTQKFVHFILFKYYFKNGYYLPEFLQINFIEYLRISNIWHEHPELSEDAYFSNEILVRAQDVILYSPKDMKHPWFSSEFNSYVDLCYNLESKNLYSFRNKFKMFDMNILNDMIGFGFSDLVQNKEQGFDYSYIEKTESVSYIGISSNLDYLNVFFFNYFFILKIIFELICWIFFFFFSFKLFNKLKNVVCSKKEK